MLPQPVSPRRIELGSDIHDLRVSCWFREGVLPRKIFNRACAPARGTQTLIRFLVRKTGFFDARNAAESGREIEFLTVNAGFVPS
jgi:hypothetical protein